MAKISEILVSAFLPVVGSVGKEQLKELLAKAHAEDEQGYKAIIQGVYPPAKRLLVPLVKKSKTKIDDTIVGSIVGAIEESAEEFGVELPDVSDAPDGE